jgi:hypothetical protein
MSEKLDAVRIDDYYELITRLSIWNYMLLPLFLLTRFCFVALLVQLPFVLKCIDIPFNRILRLVMIAAFPLILGSSLKTLWLSQLADANITSETLAFVPFSVMQLTVKQQNWQAPESAILGQFNLFELTWIGIMTFGLARFSRIGRIDAMLFVTAIWSLLILFQWLFIIYFNRINM